MYGLSCESHPHRFLGVKPWARAVWDSIRDSKADILLLGCGFPCREITSVNKSRRGLDHGDTARFQEAKQLWMALIEEQGRSDIPIRVVWENVASMTIETRDRITQELREIDQSVEMVCIDGGNTSWSSRRRLWWTNFYVNTIENETDHFFTRV